MGFRFRKEIVAMLKNQAAKENRDMTQHIQELIKAEEKRK